MSEPNSIVGVLTACVECRRDFNVAERVHSEIIGLNTRQACCLVLISDITAAAGKWGEALEARHVLQKCIIKKLLGLPSSGRTVTCDAPAHSWLHRTPTVVHDDVRLHLRLNSVSIIGVTNVTSDFVNLCVEPWTLCFFGQTEYTMQCVLESLNSVVQLACISVIYCMISLEDLLCVVALYSCMNFCGSPIF
jgi:hypothetical protein